MPWGRSAAADRQAHHLINKLKWRLHGRRQERADGDEPGGAATVTPSLSFGKLKHVQMLFRRRACGDLALFVPKTATHSVAATACMQLGMRRHTYSQGTTAALKSAIQGDNIAYSLSASIITGTTSDGSTCSSVPLHRIEYLRLGTTTNRTPICYPSERSEGSHRRRAAAHEQTQTRTLLDMNFTKIRHEIFSTTAATFKVLATIHADFEQQAPLITSKAHRD